MTSIETVHEAGADHVTGVQRALGAYRLLLLS